MTASRQHRQSRFSSAFGAGLHAPPRFRNFAPMSFRPRIKICCMKSVAEAQTAVRYGANAVGLVSHMPSGAGIVDEALIPGIAASVPPPVATFLLTSLTETDAIIAQ